MCFQAETKAPVISNNMDIMQQYAHHNLGKGPKLLQVEARPFVSPLSIRSNSQTWAKECAFFSLVSDMI